MFRSVKGGIEVTKNQGGNRAFRRVGFNHNNRRVEMAWTCTKDERIKEGVRRGRQG